MTAIESSNQDTGLVDVPATVAHSSSRPFEFIGTGKEYFRIWIVNVLLTVLTLGIYSAWAKVRRQQYFFRNTTLEGFAFDYHGDPKAILKGRLILLGLAVVYQCLVGFSTMFALVGFVLMLFVLPWIVVRSLRFRLRNMSYRGLRFNFQGTTKEAVKLFVINYLLMALTLGFWFPKAQHDLKHFLADNSQYGHTAFKLRVGARDFYRTYGVMFLLLFGAGVLAGLALWLLSMIPLLIALCSGLIGLLWYVFVSAVYRTYIQNLVWSNTCLGDHAFVSHAQCVGWLKVLLVNTVLTVLSLGLYYPFAAVRAWRYQLGTVQLLPSGSLDDFVGEQQHDTKAFGEEIADWFDLDISV